MYKIYHWDPPKSNTLSHASKIISNKPRTITCTCLHMKLEPDLNNVGRKENKMLQFNIKTPTLFAQTISLSSASVFHNTASNFSCSKNSNKVWYICVLHMTFIECNVTFKAQYKPYIQEKHFREICVKVNKYTLLNWKVISRGIDRIVFSALKDFLQQG